MSFSYCVGGSLHGAEFSFGDDGACTIRIDEGMSLSDLGYFYVRKRIANADDGSSNEVWIYEHLVPKNDGESLSEELISLLREIGSKDERLSKWEGARWLCYGKATILFVEDKNRVS